MFHKLLPRPGQGLGRGRTRGEAGEGPAAGQHSHVRTVGMRAANMRNSMEKKRKPELLRTFLASFPMPR